MATVFPILLKYKKEDGTFEGAGLRNFGISVCRLLVNPVSISVKKTSSVTETRTMGGTVFQSWPNMPDEVSFEGLLYGTRALQDFRVLQNSIDQLPHLKEVILQYKWKEYRGYILDMSVKAAADKPRIFEYSFTFKSKDAFSLTRMMLGQFTGYQAEVDYIKQAYYGIKNQFVADPMSVVTGINLIGVASIMEPDTLVNVDTAMNAQDITDKSAFPGVNNAKKT